MHNLDKDGLRLLQFDHIPIDRCFHFSTTIQGGFSEGMYQSFNLALHTGDESSVVAKNRDKLADSIGVSSGHMYTPVQTHSNEVLVIDKAFLGLSHDEQEARMNGIDALLTAEPNIAIAIGTADCVPVLIYSPERSALAVIHAGWKGLVGGIILNTINKMESLFLCSANSLLIGVGPSISAEYFEVGDEVGNAFKEAGFDLDTISYRNSKTGKLHIDLWQACRIQLLTRGVLDSNIEIAKLCTYSNKDLFFSARRQTIYSGRMLTGGMLGSKKSD